MKKITFTLSVLLCLFSFYANCQQVLQLSSCEPELYEINDHSDSDGDGNVCEAKIILTNSAFYSDNETCALSDIKWIVKVDLDADGTDDLEYSSSLPSDDVTLDDTNNNGIPDLYIPMTISNETQSIQLPDIEGPMSNHKVRWLVSDDCDLGDLCVANFHVVDNKPPTPYCVSLSTAIYTGPEFEIYAEDFNIGGFDNCTSMEDIRFSFSGNSIVPSRTVTCDDVLNSPVLLQIYFWDESDNIDFCSVYLTVIPEPFVDCFGTGEIAGFVRRWDGEPIEGVEVQLDANALEYPRTEITNSEGWYSFGENDGSLDYSLTASFEGDYLYGVSTLDLVLIVRHILGLMSFTNPYQIIAADINGDNQVKANDLFSLRKLILGVITEFPTNTSWKFIDADFEFENPTNPFPDLIDAENDPSTIEFNQISYEGYDFIGIKTGDVSY